MGTVRIIILAVAAFAAIGLAVVVNRMIAGRHRAPAPVASAAPAPEKPTAEVLVAHRDLAVGTRIAQGDLAWQTWPQDSLNPAFITNGAPPVPPPETTAGKAAAKAAATAQMMFAGGGSAMQSLNGAIVRQAILQGEPVTLKKIVRNGEGGYMSVVLQPGMRAWSMPVTVETGAGGFILPGDRVDVLSSRKPDQTAGGAAAATVVESVLTNVRVLAIDQQTDNEKNARAIVGATVTLEVPAEDVEVLARAKSQGDLSLVLRSYADMAGTAGRGAGFNGTVRIVRAGHISQVTAP